jgi:hypothetical protein
MMPTTYPTSNRTQWGVPASVAGLGPGPESSLAQATSEVGRVVVNAFALPFDAVRAQYARAARAGLIERSMLAQRDFELALGSLERLLLGPWARRR